MYGSKELFQLSNATLEQEFGQHLAKLCPAKAMLKWSWFTDIKKMMYGQQRINNFHRPYN